MWFKGCFHIHTTNSDGVLKAAKVCDWYKKHGYDFISITDHDYITISKIKYENFLIIENSSEFGRFDTDDILNILGIGFDSIRLINKKYNHQDIIDFIVKNNGLAIIHNPNWAWGGKFNKLSKLKNYHGMEIFNAVLKSLVGSPFATEKWDYLLSLGNRVWGFAVDDMHRFGKKWYESAIRLIGQGWIMVKANNLEKEEIMNSIKQGNFYSTTGVIIEDMYIDKNRYFVKSLNGEEIIFIVDYGRIIKVIDDSKGEIKINNKYKYIRCEIRSKSGIAYTQPVFLD